MKIACLVINYNGIEDTKACVNSLLKQTLKNTIFLLDNNSNHLEGEVLNKEYANINDVYVFCSAENLGFSGGCNFLYQKTQQQSDFEFIALLNNDAIAEPNWLARLVACAQEEKAGIIASKMLQFNQPNTIDNVGHLVLNTGDVLPLGNHRPADQFSKRIEVGGACGGACLIRNQLIKKVGFFDEFFFVGYEDVELSLRAILAGERCFLAPDAIVYHKMSQSVQKVFNFNYVVKLQRDIFYTFFKIMPLGFIVINGWFWMLKWLLALFFNALFFRFRYVKVAFFAMFYFIKHDLWLAIKNRESLKFEKISAFAMQRKTSFFLKTDILRFYHFFMLNKPSTFEKFKE